MPLFLETDSVDIVKVLITLISGGALAGMGAWIINLYKEAKRQKLASQQADTSNTLKKDRAKLTIDQERYEAALENNQRAYDDLYAKYLDLYKRIENLQELLLKSEIERAIAVTKLSEATLRLTENANQIEELKRRINSLESRNDHAL